MAPYRHIAISYHVMGDSPGVLTSAGTTRREHGRRVGGMEGWRDEG